MKYKPLPDTFDKNTNPLDYSGRHIGLPVFIDSQKEDSVNFYWKRRTQRKAWIYAGILHENVIASIAIIDAGYISSAFAYIFDRTNQTFYEEKIMVPLSFPNDFRANLLELWELNSQGKSWKSFSNGQQSMTLVFESPSFQLNFSLELNNKGLNTIAPYRPKSYNYTHKNIGVVCSAKLEYNHKTLEISGNYGVIDFTRGYPPNHTFWNWACLRGEAANGTFIAINLVSDFNNGLENCLWIGEQVIPLSQAVFYYTEPIQKHKTSIKTTDGILDLEFLPEGSRSENQDYFFIKSQFIQPFGKFKGIINLNGEQIKISGYGVVEEHFAVW